jgi:hypothetical protein
VVQSCLSWKYFTTASPSLEGRSPSKKRKETLRLSELSCRNLHKRFGDESPKPNDLLKSGDDVTVAGEVVTVPQMLVSLQDLNNSVIQVHGKPDAIRFQRQPTSGSALSKSSLAS